MTTTTSAVKSHIYQEDWMAIDAVYNELLERHERELPPGTVKEHPAFAGENEPSVEDCLTCSHLQYVAYVLDETDSDEWGRRL